MILCCGEALIDMIPDATASGVTCMVPKTGGAVFNTAVALGRLGHGTGLFTGVSDDMFGRKLAAELRESNVNCDFLRTLDAPTSLAFVELTDGQATYTFYTSGAADTVLEPKHCPTDFDGFDAMFFGGISLCTDPTASTLAGLMRRASDAGVITMIDPNIRTSFIKDEAGYRDRLHDMLQCADVIKLSDEDLAWVSGNQGSIQADIDALDVPATTLLLITQGSEGATAFADKVSLMHVPSVKTTVVDTIGAGDTFNAGFLAHLKAQDALHIGGATGDVLRSALAFASACASVTVSRAGANPPWQDEMSA